MASGVRKVGLKPDGSQYKARKSHMVKAVHILILIWIFRCTRNLSTAILPKSMPEKPKHNNTEFPELMQVVWPKHLAAKKRGVYTVGITQNGLTITVMELKGPLRLRKVSEK